jgi:signal transduction histidine kinase
MGLRQRSIRMRIFLLIVVPLLSLIGLYAFVATSTIGDARKAARAHSQLNSWGLPVLNFTQQMQAERKLAALYLATGRADTLAQFKAQEAKTDQARAAMTERLTSKSAQHAVTTPDARETITQLLRDVSTLGQLRTAVSEQMLSPVGAVSGYSVLASDDYAFSTSLLSLSEPEIQLEGLANIRLAAALDALQQEDAILEADAVLGTFPPSDRTAFAQLVGVRRQLLSDAQRILGSKMRVSYANNVSVGVIDSIVSFEDDVLSDSSPDAPQSVPLSAWTQDIAALGRGVGVVQRVGEDEAVRKTDAKANSAYLRLGLAGGLGLLAVVLSIAISLRIGRRLVRQLAELRRSANSLAREHLPSVMARLRTGEDVDVAAEAPLMKTAPDEIGQVGRAFNDVQHAAVQAAVEQARLRRGVSDVFRNLARRNQSLLHRQLSLLDGMERRIADPDELADLYRLDHLTTRMRRHAEGLIILSGAPIGRSWRNPVRLVDVLRAAVGEVEDYTRVSVTTMTGAALVGPAVADVIHLVAELVENATIFSPPNTPVRVTGDVVGNGFAVEIEDRGLGLTGDKLAEINTRLASPPEFDLSDTDQLGLFVAGRLAARQGIQITMRANAYGGSTAIVLIPRNLVIPEEAYADGPRAVRGGEPATLAGRTQVGNGKISEATAESLAAPPSAPALDAPTRDLPMRDVSIQDVPMQDAPIQGGPPPPVENGAPQVVATSPDAGLDRSWALPAYPPDLPDGGAPPLLGDVRAPVEPATSNVDELGLPRRVRQASLAPQLRDDEPSQPPAAAADGPAGDRSPEQTRSLMTAIQHGWQRGRSDADPSGAGTAADGNPGMDDGQRPYGGGEHRRR